AVEQPETPAEDKFSLSDEDLASFEAQLQSAMQGEEQVGAGAPQDQEEPLFETPDRKSTRLNSSHVKISYAVFCLKKKNTQRPQPALLRLTVRSGDVHPLTRGGMRVRAVRCRVRAPPRRAVRLRRVAPVCATLAMA